MYVRSAASSVVGGGSGKRVHRVDFLRRRLEQFCGGQSSSDLGAVIGLDVGSKTTGCAVSDGRGTTLQIGWVKLPIDRHPLERMSYLSEVGLN